MNKDKFWGFCENENYKVGCTGASVYIFDRTGNEITRFKGLRYAYYAKFMPGTNIIVVKTTEGMLLIYDLDKLDLVKKIVISRHGCQDGGFCFSPDGKWFYNIETSRTGTQTKITKYKARDFTVAKEINKENEYLYLDNIEFSMQTNKCYLLGYMRDSEFCYDYGFVGQLVDEEIVLIKKLDKLTYEYVISYKEWADSGFTKKVYELCFRNDASIISVSLEDIVENGWTLK